MIHHDTGLPMTFHYLITFADGSQEAVFILEDTETQEERNEIQEKPQRKQNKLRCANRN